MTGYATVKRAIKRQGPDRTPRMTELFGGCDFHGVWLDTPRLVRKWGTPEGGFIPMGGLAYEAAGVTNHRTLVAVNAFRRLCWGLAPLTQDEAGSLNRRG